MGAQRAALPPPIKHECSCFIRGSSVEPVKSDWPPLVTCVFYRDVDSFTSSNAAAAHLVGSAAARLLPLPQGAEGSSTHGACTRRLRSAKLQHMKANCKIVSTGAYQTGVPLTMHKLRRGNSHFVAQRLLIRKLRGLVRLRRACHGEWGEYACTATLVRDIDGTNSRAQGYNGNCCFEAQLQRATASSHCPTNDLQEMR